MEDRRLIAIVDDDPEIINTVSTYLSNRGHITKGFPDGKSFFIFLNAEKPDLIILDLKLPDISGFEICKSLKTEERFSAIPIVILSADAEEADKVSGLDIGADDYMVKPFSLEELKARINAVLRRPGREIEEKKIVIGGIMEIDIKRYVVKVEGKKIDLTTAEFKILECLASNKGEVFGRDKLLHYLWGDARREVIKRTIDVHVRHLREKLGDRAAGYIRNIRGVGYKLEE